MSIVHISYMHICTSFIIDINHPNWQFVLHHQYHCRSCHNQYLFPIFPNDPMCHLFCFPTMPFPQKISVQKPVTMERTKSRDSLSCKGGSILIFQRFREDTKSWEPKGTRDPMPRGNPQEIAGLMIRDYENHWFPLIRPAIRAGFFLGGGVLGGSLRLP